MFHFALPFMLKLISPVSLFNTLLEKWYHRIAAHLRISSFLLGGDYPDEESDSEDNDDMIPEKYLKTRNERNPVATIETLDEDGNPTNSLDDDQWDDTDVVEKKQSRLRYLRVPNHDLVPTVPGSKMMIPMNENDPVFGRPGETPDEVKSNWTKVYVPDRFKLRVFLFYLVNCLDDTPMDIGRQCSLVYSGRSL